MDEQTKRELMQARIIAAREGLSSAVHWMGKGLDANDRIQQVKEYRARYGTTLKEAYDRVGRP